MKQIVQLIIFLFKSNKKNYQNALLSMFIFCMLLGLEKYLSINKIINQSFLFTSYFFIFASVYLNERATNTFNFREVKNLDKSVSSFFTNSNHGFLILIIEVLYICFDFCFLLIPLYLLDKEFGLVALALTILLIIPIKIILLFKNKFKNLHYFSLIKFNAITSLNLISLGLIFIETYYIYESSRISIFSYLRENKITYFILFFILFVTIALSLIIIPLPSKLDKGLKTITLNLNSFTNLIIINVILFAIWDPFFKIHRQDDLIFNLIDNQNPKSLTTLLEQRPELINRLDNSGNAPLIHALDNYEKGLSYKYEQTINVLIDYTSNKNLVRKRDSNSVVMLAINTCKNDITKKIIHKGFDINAVNIKKQNALFSLMESGCIYQYPFLLSKGINTNQKNIDNLTYIEYGQKYYKYNLMNLNQEFNINNGELKK
jgi:hypothetical protein